MERHFKKDYEWLILRQKTAYEILEIGQNATQSDIRRAYRKKALVVHPDKNNTANAEETFREVIVSYNVLSDLGQKGEYDKYLLDQANFLNSEEKVNKINKSFKASKFRIDLRNKEKQHKSQVELETLKKRKIEELSEWYDDYVKKQSRDFSNLQKFPDGQHSKFTKDSVFPILTSVKWKNRKGVEFDEVLIMKLMGVFGTVLRVSVTENNKDNNYHYARVAFKSPAAAALAATHDFSVTADYWDTLKLRKISSLLRKVELVDYDSNVIDKLNERKLSSLDYIAYNIMTRQSL